MSPDDYQKAWQAEAAKTRVVIDPDALLEAVQRSQTELRRVVSWDYITAVIVELPLLPVFLFLGFTIDSAWTWWLIVAALVWSAVYKLVALRRRSQAPHDPDEPLLGGVKESLDLVEYQSWALRNIFWWSQLPTAIAMTIFFLHTAWQLSQNWWEALGSATLFVSIVPVVYGWTYYLNKRVERKHHEPRRHELLALLATLGDESTDEVSGDYPLLMGGELAAAAYCKPSPRRLLAAGVCFVVLLTIGVGGIFLVRGLEEGYPKLSPFTAVRWADEEPIVEIDGKTHLLYSIDGIDLRDILAYCKEASPDKWQKRFSEDLVEVMTGIGHAPGDTVRLDVISVDPPPERMIKEVAMTAGNRRKVREANQNREAEQEWLEAVKRRGTDSNEMKPMNRAAFEAELERIRASYKLPAMAAFALRGDEIIEQATVGTRSTKDNTTVGPDAQWHLGSNTKAMTATLAGMLVEEGLLRWDSTIGDVLGEAASNMAAGHRDTTLAMLLHHTAGITPNINWFAAPEHRVECVAELLAKPPSKKGRYAYSNGGYVVAGAMMEVVTGKRWEDLMRERLFEPLGMNDTGFGAPTAPGAPWGHESGLLNWKPKDPAARNADNAPVLGPAGTVHSTLEDYARFIAAHLAGAQGQPGIVSAETFATLHTPDAGDYALGWIVTERGWAGGRVLTHGGSNTLWYSSVWIAPEKDMAFFAATNAGGDGAGTALNEAIEMLIGRHLDE